jgi:hypothetical protein
MVETDIANAIPTATATLVATATALPLPLPLSLPLSLPLLPLFLCKDVPLCGVSNQAKVSASSALQMTYPLSVGIFTSS